MTAARSHIGRTRERAGDKSKPDEASDGSAESLELRVAEPHTGRGVAVSPGRSSPQPPARCVEKSATPTSHPLKKKESVCENIWLCFCSLKSKKNITKDRTSIGIVLGRL